MNGTEMLLPQMNRIQRFALIIGGAAMLICVLGAFTNSRQFFHSYLIGFLFWLGVALGCAAVLMLHHLVGGGWGYILRRLLESGTRTTPLMAVLVIPLLFGLTHVYSWTQVPPVEASSLLHFKSAYLQVPFFVIRTAVYFVVWMMLVYFLNRWSSEQDRTSDPSLLLRRLRNFSGPGLVIYGLTATFASVDWLMSLVPNWYSTAYGLLFIVSEVLTALSFVIAAAMWLGRLEPLSSALTRQRMLDLGNLILTFVMLWAYIAFAQFLIIWSGNLPEEISWYRIHIRGGWIAIVIALLLLHFALPFVLLLFRFIKSKARTLAAVAIGMLVVRLMDIWWSVEPSLYPSIHLHWMDILAPIGIGGFWVAAFVWQLKGRPLLPLQPALEGLTAASHEKR
jgi:hypothetical protein